MRYLPLVAMPWTLKAASGTRPRFSRAAGDPGSRTVPAPAPSPPRGASRSAGLSSGCRGSPPRRAASRRPASQCGAACASSRSRSAGGLSLPRGVREPRSPAASCSLGREVGHPRVLPSYRLGDSDMPRDWRNRPACPGSSVHVQIRFRAADVPRSNPQARGYQIQAILVACEKWFSAATSSLTGS